MRLLKECYLRDLRTGSTCLIDGTWYEVLGHDYELKRTGLKNKSVMLYSLSDLEVERPVDSVGDTYRYRDDLVVITEVKD